MNVAILGIGKQGKSAYEYWNTPENNVTVCDSRENIEIPEDASRRIGSSYLDGLDKFDLIIRGAPSIHPEDILKANPNAPKILEKIWSNTNEFFKVCPTKNIIGVTGTKGKGTTSMLIVKLLEAAGKRVHLGGNIGTPPLDLLANGIEKDDWVVLELANFQLIDLHSSPRIGVCLMVVPEHLDWHKDMDEYIDAKARMFARQNSDDVAIYFAENETSEKIVSASPGKKLPYYKKPGAIIEKGIVEIEGNQICRTDELKLLGTHNWQNVCAALTASWQIDRNPQAYSKVLTSFKGLPHRLEIVREVDGVTFYNDSFASGPHACEVSMDAITNMKVMIIGGYDRNLDLDGLAEALVRHNEDLRKVLLIGQSAPRLQKVLDKTGFKNYENLAGKNLADIVRRSLEAAKSGDSVVFSPGFASFDMFNNFEERGNLFKDEVDRL